MIKYASNTLLATLISFSNELANLSRRIEGVDISEVMKGVHSSRYLTVELGNAFKVAPIATFLDAGVGFGGSCLPKDTRALIQAGRQLGQPMRLLEAVDEVNRQQSTEVVDILIENIGDLRSKRVGVLGLAFKPDTDDVRESPAFPVIKLLLEHEAEVWAHDPKAITNAVVAGSWVADVHFVDDVKTLLEGVEAAILITRWPAYTAVAGMLAELDSPPLLIDGRRMFSADDIPHYAGIGRNS
jgi:UDPglucose 6-dehydrogenase/GDP-mannose 6-dehydrogenase